MTTSFPGGLDAFTNPSSGDTLASPDHAAQHADVNDAVEALQAKVGVDGSAVTTSLDYKVAQAQSDISSLQTGYVYRESVYYTSSGTFTKASYPWLKGIKAHIVGAGGSGGASSTPSTSGVGSAGSGGAGGGYLCFWISDLTNFPSSQSVTVGAGADISAGYTFGNGSTGGASQFFITAYGGQGGHQGSNSSGNLGTPSRSGGTPGPQNFPIGSTITLATGLTAVCVNAVRGQNGGIGMVIGGNQLVISGQGGACGYSGIGQSGLGYSVGSPGPGQAAGIGVGGGGGATTVPAQNFGAPGANGVVILELYA